MHLYNDYELIYLVQNENCEEAFKKLLSKYKLMIYKNIYQYNPDKFYFDDYLQEGLMLMNKAINIFEERRGKTFTRFFELILKRKIFELNRKKPLYEIYDDFEMFPDKEQSIEEIDTEHLTKFENIVFNKYFVENQNISYIAEVENKSVKQIYNAIYRIKNKI
jgi:RNA polymerase sporulation-specific sigma factor